MLSVEENVLLTQVGPGKPMGELFRRYWFPALLSEEIPGADCPPVRIRLLGEDLVAFRDTNGEPGIVDRYCPHRGAPIFFGRNEEGGLRCVYHGWKFDVTGKCVDLPNSPEGETYKEKIHIKAYPAWDRGGLIWVYMGPADKEPPKPKFEWLEFEADRRYARKYLMNSNFAQALDGNFDPSHVQFLHNTMDNIRNRQGGAGWNIQDTNKQSHAEYLETDYGLMFLSISDRADGKKGISLAHFYMPSASSGGIAGAGVYSSNIYIPIDDENLHQYRIRWSYEPFTDQQIYEDKYGGNTMPDQIPGTFLSVENKDNDYLISRIQQKNYSFTGIRSSPIQDQAVIENQRGPLMDRTQEHLTKADEPVIRMRQLLMKTARNLMEGHEPPGLSNPDAYRVHHARFVVPEGVTNEEAAEMAKAKMVGPNPDWVATGWQSTFAPVRLSEPVPPSPPPKADQR